MTDTERLAKTDGMAEVIREVVGGESLLIVAAAMGRVIGESLDDEEYIDMFMEVFTANASIAAADQCPCPECNTYTIQ